MKKIVIALLTLFVFGCSSNDLEKEKPKTVAGNEAVAKESDVDGSSVDVGSDEQKVTMVYYLFFSGEEVLPNSDGTIETPALGGGDFVEPSVVLVNGVPISVIDFGGSMLAISEYLRKGDNTVVVSNASENSMFAYVMEMRSDWMMKESSAKFLGSTVGSKASNRINFSIDREWSGPIFEKLIEADKSSAFVTSQISDIKKQMLSKDGEGFGERISDWIEQFAMRNGGGEAYFKQAKSSWVEGVNTMGALCEVHEYEKVSTDYGVLVHGSPIMSIEKGEIHQIIFVRIDGRVVIWGLQ